MDKASGNTDRGQAMEDVAMARSYVKEIGGNGGVQERIKRAYELLIRLFPHKTQPRSQWTYRRVRSFWHEEAAHVEFREMLELHHAAEVARAERKKLQKARKEHAAFIEQTARYRALLKRTSADDNRDLAS